MLLGVGAGWIPEESANHGIDPPARWAVMDERVQAWRAIWMQDEAEFDGRHVDFGPIWSWPKPAQRPHPPILVGGAGKGVIRRVLAYGDGWMPHAGMPVEQLGARISARSSGRGACRRARRRYPPSPFKAPHPTLARWRGSRDAGVSRAVLYAPPADADQVLRFLDDVTPLVHATKAA